MISVSDHTSDDYIYDDYIHGLKRACIRRERLLQFQATFKKGTQINTNNYK